jgi:hypothetical protein
MLNTLKTMTLAGLIGLSSLAAMPAHADGIYLNFGDRHDEGGVGLYLGENGRAHRHWDGDWRRSGGCSPDRALDKADRMGIHRARIDFVTDRRIGVIGRSHGDMVSVTFARAPGCPVIG